MKKDLTNHEKFLQAELKPQPCEMKELCYMYLILGNGLLLAIGIIIALIVPHTIANFVVGGMLAFIYLVLFIWYLISRNKFIYKPSEGFLLLLFGTILCSFIFAYLYMVSLTMFESRFRPFEHGIAIAVGAVLGVPYTVRKIKIHKLKKETGKVYKPKYRLTWLPLVLFPLVPLAKWLTKFSSKRFGGPIDNGYFIEITGLFLASAWLFSMVPIILINYIVAKKENYDSLAKVEYEYELSKRKK